MESLTVREVNKAVKGKLLCGDPNGRITGVSTDTRTLTPGDLFFALIDQHDGHDFIEKALDQGASGVIVSKDVCLSSNGAAAIKVSDPLWALGDLAAFYRRRFEARVVAITGSVGKTTTKEMLSAILMLKWKVLKSELNFNNEIGVPSTIFKMDSSHEIVVLELGMRGLGEIHRLASICKPSVGVITNVGMSHIERLGSQGAIADAKAEILANLPEDGLAVLNYEDGYFYVMKERHPGKIISFGSCTGADVIGTQIQAELDGKYHFILMAEEGAIKVKLPVLGHHNVFNALAAAAAAVALGVDLYTIRDGLESFDMPGMRMEFLQTQSGCTILNDAYNANPASMSAAIKTLRAVQGYGRRVAVLGNMLELGDYSEKAHRDVGHIAADGVDLLVTVGEFGKVIADGARNAGLPAENILSYGDSDEAAQELKGRVGNGDVVLVKGSRGMKMEKIVEALNA